MPAVFGFLTLFSLNREPAFVQPALVAEFFDLGRMDAQTVSDELRFICHLFYFLVVLAGDGTVVFALL